MESKKWLSILRTERAVRIAAKKVANRSATLEEFSDGEPYAVAIMEGEEIIAIFDLRDLYRKRAAIKMKDLRKAIQPRGRRK